MRRIILLIVLMIAQRTLWADTWTDPETGYRWTYQISGNEARIYGTETYNSSSSTFTYSPAISPKPNGAVTIPVMLGGKPVTGIGDFAFRDCNGLTSVTIPDGVTYIGARTFYACRALEDVTIPVGVKRIGNYAFEYCNGLTSVTIPNTVTNIGNDAFSGCNCLTNVNLTDIAAWCNISFGTIYSNPFSYSSYFYPTYFTRKFCLNGTVLSHLIIPNNVTNICSFAFAFCEGLKSVTVSESVIDIGERAFFGCSGATNIVVNANNTKYLSENGLLLTKDGKDLILGINGEVTIPDSVTNIESFAFYRCRDLMSVAIPNSVTSIGRSAFSGCSGLTSVAIPNSVTSIGSSAFYGCSGLTSVTIPNGVTSIKSETFYGCSGLTSVAIPNNVTSIGSSAFYGCSGLTSVVMPNSVTSIESSAFTRCSGLTSVTLPDSVSSIGSYAFSGCSGLTSVELPNSITSIGASAFSGCTNISTATVPGKQCGIPFTSVTNLVISDGVTSIENSAFSNCSNLTSVTIPASVTSIGSSAFYNCSGLTSVTIPQCVCSQTLSTVFPQAYQSITNVTIDSGVTLLGNSLFSGCTKLPSITIPSSVTRMGNYVFKDCATLQEVVFEGSAPDVGVGIYDGTPRSLVTYVGDGTIGWAGGISSELPEDWNGRRISLSVDLGGPGLDGGHGCECGVTNISVSLTVTNVVVHYVLNSVVPNIAVPIGGDTGFVTVVTEIKGGAVAIPESWAANYSDFAARFGNDFSAALTKPTGKRDSQGNALLVWQDYVAGTDPTNVDDVFKATISMIDGEPVVGYTPELPETEKAKRKYTIYGKARLQDEEWHEVDGDAANYNFFKVTVEMR